MNTSHNEYDMTVNSILVVLVYAFSISMRNSFKMFDKPTQSPVHMLMLTLLYCPPRGKFIFTGLTHTFRTSILLYRQLFCFLAYIF